MRGDHMSKNTLTTAKRSTPKRDWEYDGDGTKIYKLECGFGSKTLYDGGYLLWKKRYGWDWENPQVSDDGKFQS